MNQPFDPLPPAMELIETRRLRYLEDVERAWIHRHERLYLDGLERALLAGQRLCPHCGKPLMVASTPAADAPALDANVTNEPPPSGYMSREKLL